jgi:hypothetical protein
MDEETSKINSVVSSFHATVPGTVWLFGWQNNDIPEK